MREALDHWDFVIAAYVIGIGGLMLVLGWSWQSMRRSEKRREEVKRK